MAGGAAAAAGMQIQGIKADGAVVEVEPRDFLAILDRSQRPLVVSAYGGFIVKRYTYLSAYKGLIFATKSSQPVELPTNSEIVSAGKIWLPSL